MSNKRELGILATKEVVMLVTDPGWYRNDWAAFDDNTFDAETDVASGNSIVTCAYGRGATEMEAVNEFIDQWEDRFFSGRRKRSAVTTFMARQIENTKPLFATLQAFRQA